MSHKAGFVNIIGSPNVGKSTLMNALVGEKISIITSKAQTTRDRILGIVNGDDFQIIYSDTPGIIKPGYELHERMMKSVNNAFSDADIILFMTDVYEKDENVESVVEKLQHAKAPVLILLNKIDLIDEERLTELADNWSTKVKDAMVLPLSALKNFNVDTVFNYILKTLPEAPAYYPKDQLTDKPERFFVAEIIRSKIFQFYKREIPYSTAVLITEFKEEEEIIRIRAEIYVERESQKGIMIGHKGNSLKKVGTHARRDLENFKQVWIQSVKMGNIVAIVGRPNVGKSTLFNRLTKTRHAIVDEQSGVTRDRHYGKVDWNGIEFSIIDTGGYVSGSDDMYEGEIRKQARIAMEESDLILFMVDVTAGITGLDQELARILRKSKKQVYLMANKVDTNERINLSHEFYALGMDEPYCISSINGKGTGELLDKVVSSLKEKPEEDQSGLPRITVVGRPNVGKSSLINALVGEDRNIVTPQAGTTRDSINTRYTASI